MGLVRVKDAVGGYEIAAMEKKALHLAMQQQYSAGGVEAVKYKDIHAKGIIISRKGLLRLQQRPDDAADNPGLVDTSWGAHIEDQDTEITGAMFESARELGIATTVLPDRLFYTMVENHPKLTEEIALTREVGYRRRFVSDRVLHDGTVWQEPCELTLFVSYLDGKYLPEEEDGGALKFYSIGKLRQEIAAHPERFTGDLRYIVEKWGDELVRYVDLPQYHPNPDPGSTELIQQFDLNGVPVGTVKRKQAHEQMIRDFYAGRQPKRKHRHIRVMLRRSDGTFFLQKRSLWKKENAGLIDKPVGGHVGLGDYYDTAVIHECNDELAIAAAVLSPEDFEVVVRHRPEILEHQAVLKRVDLWLDYVSKGRTLEKRKKPWDELNDSAIYFGCYDGPVKLKDGEATGVEAENVVDLKRMMKKKPEEYTPDLWDLVELLEQKGLAA